MAGLQLCGKQAKKPFFISSIKKNVFSLEELNYYIYNHLNRVYRDFFSDELFEFIKNELERPDIASHLEKLAEKNATTRDFVTYILTASKYYSHHELEHIARVVENIDTMTNSERQKMEADALYRKKNYISAMQLYNEILRKKEDEGLDNHFYGRIAYSIGTIYARLFMSKNANSYFAYAYKLDPGPVYSKACVYMSVLNNDEEELLNTIINYKITDEQLSAIRAAVKSAENEIASSDATREFVENISDKEKFDDIIDNWKEEYYIMQS